MDVWAKLDDVSDRLGALYQLVGQIQHEWGIKDDRVTTVMDEIVKLSEDVEAISNRSARSAAERP